MIPYLPSNEVRLVPSSGGGMPQRGAGGAPHTEFASHLISPHPEHASHLISPHPEHASHLLFPHTEFAPRGIRRVAQTSVSFPNAVRTCFPRPFGPRPFLGTGAEAIEDMLNTQYHVSYILLYVVYRIEFDTVKSGLLSSSHTARKRKVSLSPVSGNGSRAFGGAPRLTVHRTVKFAGRNPQTIALPRAWKGTVQCSPPPSTPVPSPTQINK